MFPRVRLRTGRHRSAGAVDLEVGVLERHGLGPLVRRRGRGVADLSREKVRLRYCEPGGAGDRRAAREYKWERTQPGSRARSPGRGRWGSRRSSCVDGLPGAADLRPRRRAGRSRCGRAAADVALRRVVGTRTVVEAGLRFRDRTSDVARPDTPAGTHRRRCQLGARPHLLSTATRHAWTSRRARALAALGSDVRTSRRRAAGRFVHHSTCSGRTSRPRARIDRGPRSCRLRRGRDAPGRDVRRRRRRGDGVSPCAATGRRTAGSSAGLRSAGRSRC